MTAPILLPPEVAARVLPSLVRQADCRRVAADRRDDPAFPWDKLGDAIANEMMLLRAGIYDADTWTEERAWPRPSVEAVLCRGNSALFERIEDVPPAIAAAVKTGIDRARNRRARMIRNGDDLARMLGVDMATRERLKVWQIGATDCSWDERQERKRKRDIERRREKRRATGVTPREEYECDSLAAQARALGISADALRMRIKRAQSKSSDDVRSVTARIYTSLAVTHRTSGVSDAAPRPSGGAAPMIVASNERAIPFAAEATEPQEAPMESIEDRARWFFRLSVECRGLNADAFERAADDFAFFVATHDEADQAAAMNDDNVEFFLRMWHPAAAA